jgi:hypothetical protein
VALGDVILAQFQRGVECLKFATMARFLICRRFI